MPEKYYTCAYNHCLHNGEKVPESSAVVIGGKHYHWDCAQTKNDIREIKNIYINHIDGDVNVPTLLKVINDLVFKYDLELDYIKFALRYYSKYHIKVKSPFTLLYLRKNDMMKRKYERQKEIDSIDC